MVASAIAVMASSVRKAWWPVTRTFGNVSSRAKTSSLQHLSGTVLEEQGFLAFVDIEGEMAELAALERCDGGIRVQERAAAGVQEHEARPRPSERL